jgi:hypothetical protein
MRRLITTFLIACTALAVLSSDIDLKWTHGGHSNTVAGYVIHYGPSSKNYTNSISTGFVTNAVVSNLPPNTTLFFSGATVGFDGLHTDLGNEISITTATPTNQRPSAVKDFTLTRVDKTIY